MSQLLLSPVAPRSGARAETGLSASAATVECVNLMPSPDGSALRPATPPPPAAVPQGWMPFFTATSAGYDRLIASRGNAVGIVSRGKVDKPFTLDSPPRCATQSGDHLLVATDGRIWRLAIAADLSLSAVDATTPPMPTLSAKIGGCVRVNIPSIALGRTYSAAESLSSTDSSRLVAAARDAYEAIDREARSAGLFWHPVVAYVRALDIDGHEVATTEPRILCHPGSLEPPAQFAFTSEDDASTNPQQVDVPCWRLEAVFPDMASAPSSVAGYEIVCSPMLYDCDPTLNPLIDRPRRVQNGSDAFCTVSFRRSAVAAPALAGSPQSIIRLLGNLPSVATVAVRLPVRPSAGTCAVPPTPADSVADELHTLAGALRRTCKPTDYVSAMFSLPHSFTAAHVARSGGCLLWGNLEVERFSGWDPSQMALTNGPGAWHGYVEVTFADGSTRVATVDSTSGYPAALSPLLSYPAPDAVSMTVCVSAGGSARRGLFPLTPDPSGRRAVYVDPSLRPIALPPAEAYVVPAEKSRRIPLPSRIAAADASAPLSLKSSVGLASGAVAGLVPMHAAQSSWDYGRTRFYVFSPAGIHSLSADTSRTSLSVSLLDSRVVADERAVAPCEDGVAAVASGDIVLLSGSKVTRIADIPATRALVWVHSHHELWCLGSDFTRIICFDHGKRVYSLSTLFDPEASRAGHVIRADNGLCCVAGHASGVATDAEWQGTVDTGRRTFGPAVVTLEAAGAFDSLSVAVSRESLGHAAPAPDVELKMRGQLSAPLRRRVWLSPHRRLHISVRASGTDILLRSVSISD